MTIEEQMVMIGDQIQVKIELDEANDLVEETKVKYRHNDGKILTNEDTGTKHPETLPFQPPPAPGSSSGKPAVGPRSL